MAWPREASCPSVRRHCPMDLEAGCNSRYRLRILLILILQKPARPSDKLDAALVSDQLLMVEIKVRGRGFRSE